MFAADSRTCAIADSLEVTKGVLCTNGIVSAATADSPRMTGADRSTDALHEVARCLVVAARAYGFRACDEFIRSGAFEPATFEPQAAHLIVLKGE